MVVQEANDKASRKMPILPMKIRQLLAANRPAVDEMPPVTSREFENNLRSNDHSPLEDPNSHVAQSEKTTIRRATLSSGTLAAAMSDVAKFEAEYIQQMEALEVLPHRIQSRKVAGDIYTKQSEICILEQESSTASDGLAELEDRYAKLKLSYDQDVKRTSELEQLAKELFSAADQSKNPAARIKARKAELEVAETRPSVLRQSIAIDELDMVIQEKRERSQHAEAKIDALKVGTENDRAILNEVERQTVVHVPSFSERLPPATEQSLGNLKASLENMVSMLTETLEKAESLLDNVTEAENKRNASGTNFDQQANVAEKRRKPSERKTNATLSRELQEARNKVDEMVPLYWVGHHTRAWRMEKLRSEKAGKKGDSVLAAACWSAQNEANAKADGKYLQTRLAVQQLIS
jgi:hypothetical protein